MHDPHLQFLAIPSATLARAWVGTVVDSRDGYILALTPIAYPSTSEARFGARRRWAAYHRGDAGCAQDAEASA